MSSEPRAEYTAWAIPVQVSATGANEDADKLMSQAHQRIADLERELGEAKSETPCASCRGEDGHESGGPQGWVPGPCTCSPAASAKYWQAEAEKGYDAIEAAEQRARDAERNAERLRVALTEHVIEGYAEWLADKGHTHQQIIDNVAERRRELNEIAQAALAGEGGKV